ncbi:hypothetical protein AB9M62_30955 [Bacillales bacterium AN1005]
MIGSREGANKKRARSIQDINSTAASYFVYRVVNRYAILINDCEPLPKVTRRQTIHRRFMNMNEVTSTL